MKTDRLYLRERTKQLLEKLLCQSSEEQMNFLGIEDPDQLQQELTRIEKRFSEKTDWKKWDLIERVTQKVIGSCGFHNWYAEHERAEIGYSLNEKYRGKGYMLEALKSVIDHGFNEMKLNRIEAFIKPDNAPSKRIIEKLGFKKEGVLREHYKSENQIHDSVVYSLLRSEFEQDNR